MMKPAAVVLALLHVTSSAACVATRDLGGDSGAGAPTGSTDGADPTTSTTDATATSTTADGTTSAVSPQTDGSGSASSGGSDTGNCDPADLCTNLMCPETCNPVVSCPPGPLFECGCDCPTTCDIEETVCGIADLFDPTAVDCGVATLDDDLAAWQAARTCVLQNATDSIAFKAVFDEIGIDSLPRTAYLGLEARSYALSRLRQDIGGVPGVSTVFQAPCAALADVPGCEVSVGEPCIECQDPGDSAAACGP